MCLSHAALAEPVRAAVVLWGADASGTEPALFAWAARRRLTALRELPASASAPSARVELDRARAAYRLLQIPVALEALDAVAADAAETGAAGLGRADLVDAALLLAACRLTRSDEPVAWEALLAAASLAPGRALDPAAWSPRFVAEAHRAELAITREVLFEVSAVPADASLFVDGEPVGRGTVSLTLRPGRHYVRAERPGFASRGHVVELDALPVRDKILLQALPAPSLAALSARARLAGATTLLGAWVSAGELGEPVLRLLFVDDNGTKKESTVALGPQVGAAEIALAAEQLFPERLVVRPPVAVKRHGWAWGLGAGLVAVALGVGLGVGLGLPSSGLTAHVDLRGAR